MNGGEGYSVVRYTSVTMSFSAGEYAEMFDLGCDGV